MQLMIHQERIHLTRQTAGAVELIFRISQFVCLVYGFQTSFIERTVMGNQW